MMNFFPMNFISQVAVGRSSQLRPLAGSMHSVSFIALGFARLIIVWVLASSVLHVAAQPQGESLLKTDILGVFAHPDDETFSAATLAAYALGRGVQVDCVYCTRGEGGGNMVGTHAGAALGILREVELRKCLARLGVRRCFFLDRLDFAYTESRSITLEKWDHSASLEAMVRLFRTLRPDVVVTINPAPTPGQHGNHQAAGWLATEAYDAAADPNQFPNQLSKEGLDVWRPRKLYYSDRSGSQTRIDVNTILDNGKSAVTIAAEALSEHRSQAFGGMLSAPWFRQVKEQFFVIAKSVVLDSVGETNLLRGLPVEGLTPPRVQLGLPGAVPQVSLRFRNREAFESYLDFVHSEKIELTAAALHPDFPVVAGLVSRLSLEAINRTSEGLNTTLEFFAPQGWRIDPNPSVIRLSPHRTNRIIVDIIPPKDAKQDTRLSAHSSLLGENLVIETVLHPVPFLRVPRLQRAPPLTTDLNDSAWQLILQTAIPATNVWQGSNTNAMDCSGAFRMGHDGERIYIEVDVTDDHVISNIANNDIRGHWRSDSVEVCFDPENGAEHTLNTYKIGIIPFDQSGRARASRDADAHPGLIEETAPQTHIISVHTPTGYLLRMAIPLSEIGLKDQQLRVAAFNILIYDGDKVDAAMGENINKLRLAWSPRSGVQGRPEDWGRIVLLQ